jgi:TetR/AcrR family transcriptional regulator of autoinduction and epiphytic fitness
MPFMMTLPLLLNGIQGVRYAWAMAKNKREIDATVKREEIVSKAVDLFLAQGFDDTSMAAIARSAAIAPNTIYWYFEGKDELLIAVLDKLMQALMSQYQHKQFRSRLQRLTWLLDQFSQYQTLIAAVHARLEVSPAIKTWHDAYHATMASFFTAHLEQEGMSAQQAELMATVGTFVMEGLLSHPHSTVQRKAILAWLAGEHRLSKT